jgi:Flp pilus assembly protein TadD
MAGVFLSYDRTDRAKAASITAALEQAGHSIWWDQHIRGGAQYSKAIEQALNSADAVAVLWSQASAESAWVRDEAAAGRDSGRLVPVLIEPCTPPMGFRQYQTIDLTKSKGRARATGLQELLSAVEALAGEKPKEIANPVPETLSKPRSLKRHTVLGGSAAAAAVIAGGIFFWSGSLRSSAPIVAVRAADSGPRSTGLARDLLVNLGNIQSAGDDAAELVDGSSGAKADFIFEVADSSGSAGHSESLLLLRGDSRQVLASRDFAAPGASAGGSDQLAARAALLLGCATEAARLDGKRLALVKEYINACDQFPDYFTVSDIALLVPSLRSIVREAGDFRPAVEKLLLAESVGFVVPDELEKDAPAMLRSHIELARRIDPDMPEADIAEASLLPLSSYAQRLQLMDRAVSNHPDDPFLLAARTMELMRVGRMGDAVTDAERAERLAPLVPSARYAYVVALGYRGQIAKAFNEVAAAQQIFPRSRNLIEARFRLNLRYGNASDALRALHAYGTSRAHEAFLAARLNSTPASVDRAIGVSREVVDRFGYAASHAEVLAAFEKNDQLFTLLMGLSKKQPDPLLTAVMFRPVMKLFRQDPRFMQVAKHLGLVDYWQSSGKWPDFCFEPGLPYECRAEAAKLT